MITAVCNNAILQAMLVGKANQMAEEGTVHVYSSTLRGIYLNVFFGTTQLVRAGGRRTRSGLRLNWAGRIWGRLLLARRRLGNRSRQLPSPSSRMVGH